MVKAVKNPNLVIQVSAAGGEVVGKQRLCELLKCSRPTLDRRLKTDRDFPVLQRGRAGGGWKFDVDAVVAHVAAPQSSGRPALSVRDIYVELAKIQALRRVIETLVHELGVAIDRLAGSLGHEGLASTNPGDGVHADTEGAHVKKH